MKKFAHLSLLVLWLFAIMAPSAITLFDVENPIVVTNLNEEEQEESGKKAQDEEKMVHGDMADFSLMAQSKKSMMDGYYPLGYIDYTLEILLPPPEYLG